MTGFSEKMIISYSCIRDFMHKKSWMVSNLQSCMTHVRLTWDERLRLAETSGEDIESKLNLIFIVTKMVSKNEGRANFEVAVVLLLLCVASQ